mgnify:CR=1 FL=1
MALSLSLIVIFGILFHQLFARMHLPGILGVLLSGILMGPYGIDMIDESIMVMSGDLRKIALVVILLRAGLGIKRKSLAKVGVPALKMGFIPAILEGLFIMVIVIWLLDFDIPQAGMLGFILAAASPAVIVPGMIHYINRGKGASKGIPTMILAGVSIDDVVAITLFSTFVGVYGGQQVNIAWQVLDIPMSLISGVLIGGAIGLVLVKLFNRFQLKDAKKVLIVLAVAIFLAVTEDLVPFAIPFAALLGVMMMGFVMMEKSEKTGTLLSGKLNSVWVFAEILLFFLVGAEVNVLLALNSGLIGLGIIFAGLVARSLGVMFALNRTHFNLRERGFCVLAYWPKATVQAAIGAVPLSLGAPHGEFILAVAVLSIVVTAPLGAIAIRLTGDKVLK